jgi:hypothetical protein
MKTEIIWSLIVVSIIGFILLISFYIARRDDKKFDTKGKKVKAKKPKPTEREIMENFWEDNHYSSPVGKMEEMWYSSRTTGYAMPKEVSKKKDKTLEDQLKDALAVEDYMLAAKLRDKINKTKKSK